MAIKRFLLFTAPAAGERKQFVASFDTREEGVQAAEKLKADSLMRWQVIDGESAKAVAEHPGSVRCPVTP